MAKDGQDLHRLAASRRAGELTLRLGGRIDRDTLAAVLTEGHSALDAGPADSLVLDLSEVDYLDSAGALALLALRNRAEQRQIPTRLTHLTAAQRGLIELIEPCDLGRPTLIQQRKHHGVATRVGEATVKLLANARDTVAFFGHIVGATFDALFRHGAVRWGDVRVNLQQIGVDGLPIISLLSFLMGYIIAAMAVGHLRSISMEYLIGSVVAIAMIEEFAPLITAIIVAGRSGSAFAAEIATMKSTEEVDAIAAMGYEPVRFLAVPKLLASLIAVPLLTLFADAVGILGGLLIAETKLQVNAYSYFAAIPGTVGVFSFVVSTLKTFVFAFIIATVGCHRGFRSRGGAEGVGFETTSAVVTGILLIIVADFTFASLVPYEG